MDRPLHRRLLSRLFDSPKVVRRLGTGELQLDMVECRLRCNFCSHGLAKRAGQTSPPLGPPERGWFLALQRQVFRNWVRLRVEEELEQLPLTREPVALGGWDPLEYDDVVSLVRLLRNAGRAVRIVSPGLRLADRSFVRELLPMRPEFSLTYLSTQADRYQSMAGLPGAKELVDRALENLRGEGLRVAVNLVLTSENCHELTEMVGVLFGDLGISALTVVAVLPDQSHHLWDPHFAEKLPDYHLVGEEVKRCAARHGPRGLHLTLWNIPPCIIPERTLATGRLAFVAVAPDQAHPIQGTRSCQPCGYRPRCSGVSPDYLAHFPEDVFDPTAVAPFLDRLLTGRTWSDEAPPRPGKTPPEQRAGRSSTRRPRPGTARRGAAKPARGADHASAKPASPRVGTPRR